MTKSLASNPLLGRSDVVCLVRVCGAAAAEITPISSFSFSSSSFEILAHVCAPSADGELAGQAEKVVVRWREQGGEGEEERWCGWAQCPRATSSLIAVLSLK